LVIISLVAYSQSEAIKALETAWIYLAKQRKDTLCAAARSQSESSVKALRRLSTRYQKQEASIGAL